MLGERDRRQHPRETVCWPVMVETGDRHLQTETVDVSPLGAKLRLARTIELGARACLRFLPHDRPPMTVNALVWRADADGLAFFFWEGC
jgi:PilZ domain-containing protein